nr:unnamed protein product [Digitaria exilis]
MARFTQRGTATDLLEEERPAEGLLDLIGAPSAATGEDEDVHESPAPGRAPPPWPPPPPPAFLPHCFQDVEAR